MQAPSHEFWVFVFQAIFEVPVLVTFRSTSNLDPCNLLFKTAQHKRCIKVMLMGMTQGTHGMPNPYSFLCGLELKKHRGIGAEPGGRSAPKVSGQWKYQRQSHCLQWHFQLVGLGCGAFSGGEKPRPGWKIWKAQDLDATSHVMGPIRLADARICGSFIDVF